MLVLLVCDATTWILTIADRTDIQRDLITATSAISGFGSFLFGLLTNMPIALA